MNHALAEKGLSSLERLLPLVQRHAPGFAAACGPSLVDWVFHFALAACDAPGREGRPRPRLANPVPCGPLKMSRPERRRYYLLLVDILNSYQPVRAGGRPKKQAGESPAKSGRPLDPNLAERAYRMHRKKTALQIGRALFPGTDLTNSALRARVRRLLDLGARLAQRQKSAPSSKKPVR